MTDPLLRRAGLDYHEYVDVRRHASWPVFLATEQPSAERVHAFTTQANRSFADARYAPGDWLVFGAEASGLPADVLASIGAERALRLPMRAGQRSLNLSNAVAVAVFEAWRQNGYDGAIGAPQP